MSDVAHDLLKAHMRVEGERSITSCDVYDWSSGSV